MFLPPLTTFVTRLMETTSSLRFKRPASTFFLVSAIFLPTFRPPSACPKTNLEFEPRLAGRFSQSFHATVVQVAAAVEHNALDALLLRALGDQLAHFLRSRDIAAVRLLVGLLAERRRGDKGDAVL